MYKRQGLERNYLEGDDLLLPEFDLPLAGGGKFAAGNQQPCLLYTSRLFDMTDRDACRQALTGCFADLIILCAGTCEYLDHGQRCV